MKFLLDANVEFRLATFLTSTGHDVKTIAHDFPASLKDHEVLTLAVEEKRILITNDRDYGELIFRQHLPHCGIIYFRLKNSQDISEKLHSLETVLARHKNNLHAYIVIAQNGIRVRKSETEQQVA
jgi:predicted nuclease of predicted toxin-antitoxin system